MSKKEKPFKFGFQNVIRILIFSVLIYFLISFLSSGKNDSVLGDSDPTVSTSETVQSAYNFIPASIRQQIENLGGKIGEFQKEGLKLPEKQINEIKKGIIKNIYENIIKSIDKQ